MLIIVSCSFVAHSVMFIMTITFCSILFYFILCQTCHPWQYLRFNCGNLPIIDSKLGHHDNSQFSMQSSLNYYLQSSIHNLQTHSILFNLLCFQLVSSVEVTVPYLPTVIVTSVNIVFNHTGCCHLHKDPVMKFEVFFVLLKSPRNSRLGGEIRWLLLIVQLWCRLFHDPSIEAACAGSHMATIRAVQGDSERV